jgi:5-methylthioadenosine/S-adenosylhomocysteine deaminase
LIRGGVTGSADQFVHAGVVGRAALDSGLRAQLSWWTFRQPGGEIGATLPEIAKLAAAWQGAGDGRITSDLGPDSQARCSPAFIARTAAVADRLGIGMHMRVAETTAEVAACRAAHDRTPVEFLEEIGALDVPVIAVRCVSLTEPDMEILARSGVWVVACPS